MKLIPVTIFLLITAFFIVGCSPDISSETQTPLDVSQVEESEDSIKDPKTTETTKTEELDVKEKEIQQELQPTTPSNEETTNDCKVEVRWFADLERAEDKFFFDSTYPRLLQKYGDQIFVTLTHAPQKRNKYGDRIATAAQCAHKQGMLMEYVSVLIDHQDELFRNNKSELEYAQDAKLGTALFESCLISNTPEDEIAKHAREVVFREIISTPTVIVGKDRLTNTRARFQGVELSVDHYLSTCSQDTVLIYPEFMEVKCGEKIPTQGVFNVVNEKGSFAEFEVKRAENISSLIEYLFIDAKGIERRPTARDGRLFDIRGADNSGDFVFRANLVDEEVVTTQICE